jgi:hypothetical protein
MSVLDNDTTFSDKFQIIFSFFPFSPRFFCSEPKFTKGKKKTFGRNENKLFTIGAKNDIVSPMGSIPKETIPISGNI